MSSADARLFWSMIPHELTPALAEMHRHSFAETAREEVLEIARVKAARLPDREKNIPINICWLLEESAKEWLARKERAL
jgi:hypothetical protein